MATATESSCAQRIWEESSDSGFYVGVGGCCCSVRCPRRLRRFINATLYWAGCYVAHVNVPRGSLTGQLSSEVF
jgi:hypothetical protein